MAETPADHGSDRYDYIEIDGPEGTPLPGWLTADWHPCADCRANAFLRWTGDRWDLTVAHDDGCPALASGEASS